MTLVFLALLLSRSGRVEVPTWEWFHVEPPGSGSIWVARYHPNDSVSQFLTSSVCGQRVNPLKVLEWALAGIRFCNFMCPVLGLQSEPPLVFPLCIRTQVWKPDSCPSCGCLLCGIFPLSLFQSHVLCFWFSFCALQPHGFSSLAWAYHTAAASGPLLETPFTCSWTR